MNRLTSARFHHEKEYLVTVDKEVTADFVKKMESGIYIPELRQKTRKCRVKKIRYNTFTIVLNQGLNRQIRRMCDALGYHVKDLLRIRISGLKLKDLELNEGEYRELTADELRRL